MTKRRGTRSSTGLKSIGKEHNATPAQVALAWVLSKPFVSSVLLGANKLSQLEDNLGAADLQIEDLAALDQMTNPVPVYPNFFSAMVVDESLQKAFSRAI